MSDEWLEDFVAIPLIRDARGVSEAVALKLLIEACGESLVRTRQRACWEEEKDFGLMIPAFLWRDAHFADGVLFEAGTDVYTHPGEEGGYGHGVNGIIEFNAEDLHYWLNVAPPPHKQRSASKGRLNVAPPQHKQRSVPKGSLNVAPTQHKQRSAPKGERVREVINVLFPGVIPPQKDVPNSELKKRVHMYLKEHGYDVSFHDDLILREAGRKPKSTKAFKAPSLMP